MRKMRFGVAVGCFATFGVGFLFVLPLSARVATGMKDSIFLDVAAQADMTAANLGQMAQDKAENAQVKDFAKTLAQDHTADYQQLTELSQKIGDTIPKAIDRSNEVQIKMIERSKGKLFDREFLQHEIAVHTRLIQDFKDVQEHSSNGDVRAYAEKALPTLERHLHDAQNITKELGHKS